MGHLDAAMELVSMESVISRARRHKLYGVAILAQREWPDTEYVALCIGKDGACDPRNWNPAKSIEEALRVLSDAMDREWGKS